MLPFRSRPALTLADVYGPGLVNNPRPPFTTDRWLPSEPTVWDGRTGSSLSILGGMPILCSAGLLTKSAIRMMELAGIEPTINAFTYDDRDTYETHVREIRSRGQRLVFHHYHPPTERAAADYWIDPTLLAWLNDKASLDTLVPQACLPQRRLVRADDVSRLAACDDHWPLVLKGTGPAASGGGYSVAIVAHPDDLPATLGKFAADEMVVVEEFVDIRANCCLNYATLDGRSVFLGGSEQVTDAAGGFHGNWLGPDAEPTPEMVAVGHEILDLAIKRGYRGLAGFDMVLDAAGRVRVLDLNFRINFSTSAMAWMPTLRERHGDDIRGRNIRLELPQPASRWWPKVVDLVRAGSFFPLAVFTPDSETQPDHRAALHGIWLGRTRDETERKRWAFLQSIGVATRAA
ncbi:MAG: hypothetical protein WD060_03755 [Pirellulales bacterium]